MSSLSVCSVRWLFVVSAVCLLSSGCRLQLCQLPLSDSAALAFVVSVALLHSLEWMLPASLLFPVAFLLLLCCSSVALLDALPLLFCILCALSVSSVVFLRCRPAVLLLSLCCSWCLSLAAILSLSDSAAWLFVVSVAPALLHFLCWILPASFRFLDRSHGHSVPLCSFFAIDFWCSLCYHFVQQSAVACTVMCLSGNKLYCLPAAPCIFFCPYFSRSLPDQVCR